MAPLHPLQLGLDPIPVGLYVVQSFCDTTLNKLQQKFSEQFPTQKNVLNNILKVLVREHGTP